MPPYKTIVLELILTRPKMYEQLRSTKRLLPAIETYAIELKASHELMKNMIRQEEPDRDPRQVESEALEYTLLGFEDNLLAGWPEDDTEPLSLDGAMTYLNRHTPSA